MIATRDATLMPLRYAIRYVAILRLASLFHADSAATRYAIDVFRFLLR